MPTLKSLSKGFGLVGGTAIALHVGHRQSIDFDFFTASEFDNFNIQKKIRSVEEKVERVFADREGEYTVLVRGVKITFFHHPFKIVFSEQFENFFKMADLLTLAAIKAYALGRRAKWKDYVDLYFILKNHLGIKDIIGKAKEIFGTDFNEKIFRSQLSYFQDIDHSEKIIYAGGQAIDDKTIEKELINFSLLT